MACNGCNDGCFDESIQSTQGPQGAAGVDGADGADGSNGTDGVAIIQANVVVTSTTSNSYATGAIQSDVINGTTIDFGTVDDILKMKFGIIGDQTASPTSPTDYHWQVLYGSDTIIDTTTYSIFKLNSDDKLAMNGAEIELDLVVSATDTIIPILRFKRTIGFRTTKWIFSTGTLTADFYSTIVLPAVSISSPISGNNTLKLSVKNGDNSSTVDIVHYELIKYLK